MRGRAFLFCKTIKKINKFLLNKIKKREIWNLCGLAEKKMNYPLFEWRFFFCCALIIILASLVWFEILSFGVTPPIFIFFSFKCFQFSRHVFVKYIYRYTQMEKKEFFCYLIEPSGRCWSLFKCPIHIVSCRFIHFVSEPTRFR